MATDRYDAGTIEPQRPHVERGTRVGDFEVVGPLGRGGMGEVYLAHDTLLDREVALKVVPLDRSNAKAASEAFMAEARTTASFNHPNVVTVYGVGTHDGRPYLALEYVEGHSLRDHLDSQRPTVHRSLEIAATVAEVLARAHERRIVHRDLKPSNVLLGDDGRLRVADFGIARELAPSQLHVTGRHGTPAYMAPECWRGRSGPEADVWALGTLLFELLAGHRPYASEEASTDQLRALLADPHPPPGLPVGLDVPEEIPALIREMLSKDARARPAAREVAHQLHEAARGEEPRRAGPKPSLPGLAAYEEVHEPVFFGREREVATVLERLADAGLTVVYGPRGSGKTSLVIARVLPTLRREHARPHLVLSARDPRPFLALARGLLAARSGSATTTIPCSEAEVPHGDGSAPGEGSEVEHALAEALDEDPDRLREELEEWARHVARPVLIVVDDVQPPGWLDSGSDHEAARLIARLTDATSSSKRASCLVVCSADRPEWIEGVSGDGQAVRIANPEPTDLASIAAKIGVHLQREWVHAGYPGALADAVTATAAPLPVLQLTLAELLRSAEPGGPLGQGRSAHDAMSAAIAAHRRDCIERLPSSERRSARRWLERLAREPASADAAFDSAVLRHLLAARVVTEIGTDSDARQLALVGPPTAESRVRSRTIAVGTALLASSLLIALGASSLVGAGGSEHRQTAPDESERTLAAPTRIGERALETDEPAAPEATGEPAPATASGTAPLPGPDAETEVSREATDTQSPAVVERDTRSTRRRPARGVGLRTGSISADQF